MIAGTTQESLAPLPIPVLSDRPLWGSLLAFRNDRLTVQRRAAQEHGDICRVRLGPISVFMVASAELAHSVFVENADAYIKSRGLELLRPLLGLGLLTSEQEFHARQRRLISPAFQHRRVAGYATSMADLAERHLGALKEGQRVDVADQMMRLTLAIAAKTLLNAEVDGEATELGAALTVANRHVSEGVTQLFSLPLAVPVRRNVRFRSAIARVDRTLYRIVAERRASGDDKGDVLSMLLGARDETTGEPMPERQVRDEALTLFVAGHETTANALSWTIYLLARHPEVATRVCAEVDSVLAGRTPAYDDLARLPYTLQVLKESMRLFPPAYLVGRRAHREVTLAGHRLAKGTIVLVNVYGMQRRAKYFRDPDTFDPERFDPTTEKNIAKGAYLPFGAGPRVCIGNHFAMMEGHVVLAALAQRIRFEVDSAVAVEPEPLITLRPRGGLPAVVRRR